MNEFLPVANGTTTTLSHAVRITKPNVFDDQSLDFIGVVSNQPLTVPQASDDALLLSRTQSGLVTMAIRYDGRNGRGEKLFNATLRFKGGAEPVLLPDLVFKNTWKAGAGIPRDVKNSTTSSRLFTLPQPAAMNIAPTLSRASKGPNQPALLNVVAIRVPYSASVLLPMCPLRLCS